MIVETLFVLGCVAFVIVLRTYIVAIKQAPVGLNENTQQNVLSLYQSGPEGAEALSDDGPAIDQHRSQRPSTRSSDAGSTQDRLRTLMGIALTRPTPEAILEFSGFASRLRAVGAAGFRPLGPYNIMMVFTQRPGARAVASRKDWVKAGQTVRPDAIPILILRPNGPIMQVFELEDTLPKREKDPDRDAFAAAGDFKAETLHGVIERLSSPNKRNLKVDVDFADLGSNSAGWICEQPNLLLAPDQPLQGEPHLKALQLGPQQGHWRVMLNRRLTPAEQFATLLHELGHLFCGHVGPFQRGNALADEYGWPDRSSLPYPAMEIEAELVSWHICERRGLVTGSAVYLRSYMENAAHEMQAVDLDRVTRAIAKIEHYVR